MNIESTIDHQVIPDTAGMESKVALSSPVLRQQNHDFHGTGGVSQGNSKQGFLPAFIDRITGEFYLSCFADGRTAPVHVLDGMPARLVAERNAKGFVTAAVDSVTAGFVRGGLFYTREQAAKAIAMQT